MALNYIRPPQETPLFSDEKHQFMSQAWIEWFANMGRELDSLRTEFDAFDSFVDRGDPTAVDYTLASFTADATWRDKDLSAIVPVGAKSVVFAVRVNDAAVGTKAMFRKNGMTNAINVSTITTQVAATDFYADLIVACDSSRVIEYNIAAAMDAINLTVKGWFI